MTGNPEVEHDEPCGPEVGFWEIAIDVPEARFWITSVSRQK
jgi:hypothetical protein